ncbi:hypothetical protein G6F61_014896 [Rhizopus arrhizus]|nr:hypothetical protein G6F61_014896 [Rhizopus arrhizus]
MGALDRGTQNASVRVRIEGDHAALNLKSRTIGHTRQERADRQASPSGGPRRADLGSGRVPRRQRRPGRGRGRAGQRRPGHRPAGLGGCRSNR